MKKIWLICIAISAAITGYFFITNKEEQFVNPVFYEKMISNAHSNYETELTPSHIYIMESDSFKHHYKCKLINNQMDTVSLECLNEQPEKQKEGLKTFTYTLTPCTEENLCLDKEGWLVTEQRRPKKYYDKMTYIIPSRQKDFLKNKFVNPLFSEKLSPISRGSRPTFLTPTSLTYLDIYDKAVVRKCELLENTPMFITMRCSFYNNLINRIQTYEVRYVLKGCNSQKEFCFGGKWFVLENEEGSGIGTFVIKDPNEEQQ